MTYNTKGIPYKHNKTGNLYYLLMDKVIECTNGREEIRYAVYMSAHTGMIFCRESDEFYQKFTIYKCNKNKIS